MAGTKSLARPNMTIGDAAVDGLLNGVVAGIGMALYLMLATLAQGNAPWLVLGAFDPANKGSLLVGAVMHLAVAGVYGAVFGLLWKGLHLAPFRLPGWQVGLIYGGILFLIAEAVLLPSTPTAPREIPLYHFAIAHLVYGLVLGWLMGRTPAGLMTTK